MQSDDKCVLEGPSKSLPPSAPRGHVIDRYLTRHKNGFDTQHHDWKMLLCIWLQKALVCLNQMFLAEACVLTSAIRKAPVPSSRHRRIRTALILLPHADDDCDNSRKRTVSGEHHNIISLRDTGVGMTKADMVNDRGNVVNENNGNLLLLYQQCIIRQS